MKTDDLMQDRESWQTIDHMLKDGARHASTINEEAVDAPTAANRSAWQHVIDHTLIEWGRNPGGLEDDGLDPPSADMIQRAIDFAQVVQQAGYPPPTSVVPDPNGGIVFERTIGDTTEEYHFWDDGTVDYCRFEGTRLVERRSV